MTLGVLRIAVAGGTGTVGRHVVAALRSAGHYPVVMARSTGVDLVSGRGVDAALVGAAAVIDVSGVVTTSRRRSVAFFGAGTRHLLEAGRRAGVGHHVALSIIGIDRVDYSYYAGKRLQEELVLSGAVPGTVVRAAQFHEFAGQVLAATPGPVALVPRMRIQPVAAAEAAAALVHLATTGEAAGRVPDLAGPEEHDLVDLARRVLRARQERRLVVAFRLPGASGRAMAGGGLLPTGPGPRGSQTFDAWLTSVT